MNYNKVLVVSYHHYSFHYRILHLIHQLLARCCLLFIGLYPLHCIMMFCTCTAFLCALWCHACDMVCYDSDSCVCCIVHRLLAALDLLAKDMPDVIAEETNFTRGQTQRLIVPRTTTVQSQHPVPQGMLVLSIAYTLSMCYLMIVLYCHVA